MMGNNRSFPLLSEKLIWGLTELFLWIQLVAEGSPSKRRALGVAMAKVRRVNVEGSAFQFIHRKSSLSSQKRFVDFAGKVQ